MGNKDAINYARELFKRGFTRDASRDILISRGYNGKDVDNALNVASKPEKSVNITLLLGITITLIILLIPTLFFITKATETKNLSQQSQFQQGENQDALQDETKSFECITNEDCFIDEVCTQGYCITLKCSSCEQLSNRQCTPIDCSDDEQCTNDYCLDGVCNNVKIESCNFTTTSNQTCITDFDCSDGDINTLDYCVSENQTKTCTHLLPQCLNNDDLCPANCTTLTDNDCNSFCGNNITESNEECDGNCPSSQAQCNDNNACTVDALLGSASLCTAECSNTEIVVCASNDGCCPYSCVYSLDNDCTPNSTLLANAQFTSVQRPTSGSAELYSFEDSSHKVTFSPTFSIANAETHPELKVYLAIKPIVITKEDLDYGNINIGELKSTGGAQQYNITGFISDITSYKSIVIFHKTYNSVYSYATLA